MKKMKNRRNRCINYDGARDLSHQNPASAAPRDVCNAHNAANAPTDNIYSASRGSIRDGGRTPRRFLLENAVLRFGLELIVIRAACHHMGSAVAQRRFLHFFFNELMILKLIV
jgi:hypothetical protein